MLAWGSCPLLTTLPCSAITVGVPAEVEGEISTGLCWQQQGDRAMVRGCQWAGGMGDTPGSAEGCDLQVMPVPAPGRRSLARKDVKSTLTRYRVLSAVGGCALLQLQPRTGEWSPNTSATPGTLPDPCNLTFSLFLPSLPRAAPGASDAAAVPSPG